MLRPNLDELLLSNHDKEVPESLSGKPSNPPSPASIGANKTSLFDKADQQTMFWQTIVKILYNNIGSWA